MLNTKSKALWATTAAKSRMHPKLRDQIHADVLVIGAGFTGLRAALRLADAGVHTVVLDAEDVAFGASGRSGGQVNPMLPHNTPDKLKALLGTKYFERLTETSLESADELFGLIEQYQIDCQARQSGWLRVTHFQRTLRDTQAGVTEWNRYGANLQIIEGTELTRRSGSRAYRAGVLTPRGGAVQPLSLANGLASSAKQRGCKIFGNSAVLSINKSAAGSWQAKTENGSVTAEWIIVATNGYTGDLIPKLSKSIIPVTPIQIATYPLPKSVIGDILPEGHTISDSRRVIMYARREPDDRMVYGGLGKLYANGNIGGVDWLRKDAERVFPQLKGVTWSHQWGGRIAVTEDHLPHLHEPQPGIIIGLGYNGRGVAMSHIMGRVMADRVMGKDAKALPFPVCDIAKIKMRALQVGGMSTAVWFMRFLDYIETRT